jgi:hypothetical protein
VLDPNGQSRTKASLAASRKPLKTPSFISGIIEEQWIIQSAHPILINYKIINGKKISEAAELLLPA